jgi:bifunctional UDP-N-acetylglucosamine pyrophosphorylase/glucosamine-1-phosphate N-acetyltransferase
MGGRKGPGLSCVILAAGLGTRMKSSLPKVLHAIYGRPMISYVVEAARGLRPLKTVVVAGRDHGLVADSLKEGRGITIAVQKEQKGTAHALQSAMDGLKGFRKGTVLVMNGDTPLIRSTTLRKFVALHRRHKNSVSLLSFIAGDPASYGRVIRDKDRNPLGIVEHGDANPRERAVKEVNSGVYAIETSTLPLLRSIKRNEKKKEYYLTDIVEIALRRGIRTGVHCLGEEEEFHGINTRQELSRAHDVMRMRTVRRLLDKGVSFIDADSVFIAPGVNVGADTIIYPNVCLEGGTTLGKGCTIYPNVRIIDSVVRDGATIKDSSVIEGSTIGRGVQLGPFAHIRPESRISAGAKIGNFVEVKKSTVGKGTKAMHLSYIGDARVGEDVNIGAGTITCNYDGVNKHRTVIGGNVFVGSDTQLVAPVTIGRGSYIGAGSTITKDVPPKALSLSRSKQRTIMGWAERKKKK